MVSNRTASAWILGFLLTVPVFALASLGFTFLAFDLLFESHDARCSDSGNDDLDRLTLALPMEAIGKTRMVIYDDCDSGGVPYTQIASRFREENIVKGAKQSWGCTEIAQNNEAFLETSRTFGCQYQGATFDLWIDGGAGYGGDRYVGISLADSYSPDVFPSANAS